MYRFREILVALDLSKTDENMIKYAFGVANVVEAEEVIFMHVAQNQDLKETVQTEEGKSITRKEELKLKISNIVDHCHKIAPNTKAIVEVLTGDPITIMLKASKEQKVDLIMVGRKSVGEGSGKVSRSLARRALCAVMSVPFNAKLELNKVILPIDYSKFSKMAIEKAIALSKKRPELEIICLNIYTLPQGYLSSGKSEEEFAKIMKQNAEKEYNHFMKQFDLEGLKVTPRFQLDTKNFFAKIIFNVALVEDANLIIIGSKGRTTMAAAFLGSTTEKLLKFNIAVPTMILKSRKQNLGFFEALLKI
jgi:nucleotide-binding universal stress UspA family protein